MRTTLDIDANVLAAAEALAHYGFLPLTSGGHIVTNDVVRAIRDELGD